VLRVVAATAASDGAGVRLKRSIGGASIRHLDPFLMLDEFRSDDAQDYLPGFPAHPHRGFETVTYMLQGRMRHEDSCGNRGLLIDGSVQWMTAGRGIIHSEMPEQTEGRLAGFQLWVNLPAARKMTAPRYQDIPPEDIPVVVGHDGVRVKVIAGSHEDVTGPIVRDDVAPFMLDVTVPEGQRAVLEIPDGHTVFLYTFEGAVQVEDTVLEPSTLAVLAREGHVEVASATGGRCLVVAGRPIGEPIAQYGPFVMNTREELHQAVKDYHAGRLAP
jgi:hypothetical protein